MAAPMPEVAPVTRATGTEVCMGYNLHWGLMTSDARLGAGSAGEFTARLTAELRKLFACNFGYHRLRGIDSRCDTPPMTFPSRITAPEFGMAPNIGNRSRHAQWAMARLPFGVSRYSCVQQGISGSNCDRLASNGPRRPQHRIKQPGKTGIQVFPAQCVDVLSTLRPCLNHAGLPQHPEVMRSRGFGHRQAERSACLVAVFGQMPNDS